MKSPLNDALDRKWIEASAAITKLERELTAERERADRNQEDAERYQWLRMNRLWLKANLPMIHAGAFDAAIDAARRK